MKPILKINKVYKFPYAVIFNNNEVYLFDKSIIEYSCLYDDALVDVEVVLDKAGLLHIKAGKLIWELTRDKISISDLKEPVAEKSIKFSKGNKFFGIKPSYYVEGWYCLKNPKPVKYIMNNFKIVIKE
jgi:hypothetical protein